MSGQWDRIEAMLGDRIGLDPVAVGPSVIPRAVRARMNELGLADVDRYSSLLSSSEVELQALIEEVIVPESWFFRDEVPFRHFQDHVRSRWVANPAQPPLRILSIPCAGGEEPYSLVMALEELGLDAGRYQVTAVDISARRLEVARQGIFSSNAFRGSDLSFRDRHFRKHPRGFVIDPLLCARVRFLQGSVLDPSLLSNEPAFDVVFCRNLLIYLDKSSRARAMSVINHLLIMEGLLIIGHADRIDTSPIEPALIPIGNRRTFTYRKTTAPLPYSPVATLLVEGVAWKAPQLPSPRSPKLLTWQSPNNPETRAASQVPEDLDTGQGLESQIPSRHQLSSDFADRGSGSLLDQASRLANLGYHGEAVALCEQSLRQHGPTAPAYYLMGVIHQSLGSRTKGEECFQKAVYLDPGHDEALLALALSAERRGDTIAAVGFRRRAHRALSRKEVK